MLSSYPQSSNYVERHIHLKWTPTDMSSRWLLYLFKNQLSTIYGIMGNVKDSIFICTNKSPINTSDWRDTEWSLAGVLILFLLSHTLLTYLGDDMMPLNVPVSLRDKETKKKWWYSYTEHTSELELKFHCAKKGFDWRVFIFKPGNTER